ncbi:hypothetical protein F4808DRAFT_352463 [Astrocystis sublimbata]|nr:hypothetical protein F4808DRAFT_352463 [Astrocystis sublimbata]
MKTDSLSPIRRHILSSINPDSCSISPPIEKSRSLSPTAAPPASEPRDHDEKQTSSAATAERAARKTSKFRFKSEHSRSHRSSRHDDHDHDRERSRDRDRDRKSRHSADVDPSRDHDHDDERRNRRHRHHRRHHHHRHKRRRTRSRSPTPPNPYAPPPLDSEAAFRESLFDAMADDEGAAYWEGVYGQPIHVYSQERAGPEGELERMGDEEYAKYVRQKMWEKTHQGLIEERARREEARKRKERDAEEATRLTREMEQSLRRGEERRVRKGWKDRFEAYAKTWESWDGTVQGIAWPVRSGRREDVGGGAVREFLVMGIDPVESGEAQFLTRLKDERVRWHPDKIQQRLGGRVDEAVMRDVTAVFQIVDRLWTDTRSKQTA